MLNRIIYLVMVMMLSVMLSGCADDGVYAPVVNGWQQQTPGGKYYRVQKGDTLYSIAWAFGTDFRDLARINHLSRPYKLYSGQRLLMTTRAASKRSFRSRSLVAAPTSVKVTQYPAYRSVFKPAANKVSNNKPRSQSVIASKAKTRNSAIQSAQVKPKATSAPISSYPVSRVGVPSKNWTWPTRGRVIRGFSTATGGNRGLDIAGRLGQLVIAAAPGRIVYSGSGLRGYGKLIIIKHNDSYLSAYAFNKYLLVKEGVTVKQGQPIAEMGQNDGGQTMLHFEIRLNGKPVNPLFYLAKG